MWGKTTLRSLRKIKGGVRSVFEGVFGFVSSFDKVVRDFQFLVESREWDLPFGPVYGEAGTITTICVQPQSWFRGQKMMATDTAGNSGYGTRITQVLIGQRLQRPATGGGTLTLFFRNGALGNDIEWDDCHPALSIATTVSFIESCTFDMVVFGRAIL